MSIHIPTITELIRLPIVDDAQLSPNGRSAIFTVTTPNWDKNEYVTQLWQVDTNGRSAPRQLTFAKTSSHTPRWSPDGNWIVFISKRQDDKVAQIYRLSPFGGEAERLTELEATPSQLAWSPNGRFLAFLATNAKSKADKEREEAFGDIAIEDVDYRYQHLWLLDIEQKAVQQLTNGRQYHIFNFDWSPDSQQIAFHASATPNMEDYDRGKVYRLNLDTLIITMLTDEQCGLPKWSPDGNQIAYVCYGFPTYSGNNSLKIMNADGSSQQTLATTFDERIIPLAWRKEGLYFNAQQRVEAHLFRIDPLTDTIAQMTPQTELGWYSVGASWSAAGEFVTVANDQQHVNEVCFVQDETLHRLTSFTEETAVWQFSPAETICWASKDGAEIEGIITKPADFDPKKKYPLLVIIHGGPTGTSTIARLGRYERRAYPFAAWLAKGAIILQPNYRGSAGYGEAFRTLNHRNLGLGDYDDVISGVDALIAKGWVDPERVGSMGWSQGGYISAFITTYSHRFKAVSVGAGISNWQTYYVNTDIHPFTRKYLEATPWEDKEIYEQTSPMTYINNAQTPTLIQHGEKDARVPLPNARELYQGLRDVGVETRLVIYPGMGHGPSKPRQSRHIMQDNLDWFNRWIFGETAAESAAKSGYLVLESENEESKNKVKQLAHRDDAYFYCLATATGLLTENMGTKATLANVLKQQITDAELTAVIIYAAIKKENLALLGALFSAVGAIDGCELQLAAPPD
ncbi:MAG: S9 family peptidase [Chloroflexota bacterium]